MERDELNSRLIFLSERVSVELGQCPVVQIEHVPSALRPHLLVKFRSSSGQQFISAKIFEDYPDRPPVLVLNPCFISPLADSLDGTVRFEQIYRWGGPKMSSLRILLREVDKILQLPANLPREIQKLAETNRKITDLKRLVFGDLAKLTPEQLLSHLDERELSKVLDSGSAIQVLQAHPLVAKASRLLQELSNDTLELSDDVQASLANIESLKSKNAQLVSEFLLARKQNSQALRSLEEATRASSKTAQLLEIVTDLEKNKEIQSEILKEFYEDKGRSPQLTEKLIESFARVEELQLRKAELERR